VQVFLIYRSSVNQMWILSSSKDLVETLSSRSQYVCSSIKMFDFTTLYTTILITLLKYRNKEFIHRCFSKKNGDQWYQYSIIGRYKSYFVKSHSNSNNEYKQDEIIQILHCLTDTIFVMFGGWVFQLVFQWVRIVLRYSPICFYMLMKQTSFNGFSRIKMENNPDL